MAGMVNLKLTAAEQKEEAAEWDKPKPPEYPWGVRIDLDDETITKLGLGRVNVGDVFTLAGKCVVTSYSENRDQYGGGTNAGFQITDLMLEPDGAGDRKSTAAVLYGDDKDD